MKIAIDESGDGGVQFWRGSSPWFVVAAVIVPDVIRGCGLVCSAVDSFRSEAMMGSELHFAHNSHEQHEKFFAHMHGQDYFFIAVAIDKKSFLRRRPHSIVSKKIMLKSALDLLFSELKPYWDNPLILMDGNSRQFDRMLKLYLLRAFGAPRRSDIRHIQNIIFVDSRTEPLVQFADYVAGAVRHHVDKSYNSRSYERYLVDKGKILFI
jgi:hypothetical protein